MAHPARVHTYSKRLMSVVLASLLVAALVPFQAVIAFAETPTGTTWYVAVDGDDGDAGTQAEPLETLYEAVYERAEDGDTILVGPGFYPMEDGPIGIFEFSSLKIASTSGADVTMLMSGGGDAPPIFYIEDSEGVVIDGFSLQGADNFAGALFVAGSTFKLSNCEVAGNIAEYGGGLLSIESTVTVEGCEFYDNFAFSGGSAIAAGLSKLAVKDSEFSDNGQFWFEPEVTRWGGAIALTDCLATISGSTFENNTALNGGAVHSIYSKVDLMENVFTNNAAEGDGKYIVIGNPGDILQSTKDFAFGDYDEAVADLACEGEMGYGGAVALYDGEYTVSSTEFTENRAWWSGGAMHLGTWAGATVSDSVFDGNSGMFGAAIHNADDDDYGVATSAELTSWDVVAEARTAGDVSSLPGMPETALTIERSVFSGNTGLGAPAVYVDTPYLTSITNSLFVGNDSEFESTVAAFSWLGGSTAFSQVLPEMPVTMDMANCTFADNTSGYATSLFGEGGNWDVRNTVFWGNVDSGFEDDGPPFDVDAISWSKDATSTFTYCDFENGYVVTEEEPHITGEGNFSADPMFADDYNLTSGSPCADTGTSEGAPADDITGWMRPMDGDGDGERAFDVGAYEYYDKLIRDVGTNRYATAVEACQQHFDEADTVIVATGEIFADGLSAAGLAGSYNAPLLLSPHGTMPALVKAEITRLGATHAVVIGGENAISAGVMGQLSAMGLDVDRIGGANRYSTAAMVAKAVATREGDDFSGIGFVARGDTFPDALSVSPIAYAMKSPILLVKPTSMPQATIDVIEAVDFDEFMIAGGPDAVSSMAVSGLAADSVQIGGIDRYDTSAKVSDYAVEKGWAQMTYTGIATGEDFPDALTGGAALGAENGVLLLTPYKSLHSSAALLMQKRADEVKRVEVLGGEAAVSASVYTSIANILD